MGLAASQARLLTITSRKADCEFLSMNLSHQKLALARDMENISSDYQNAMNKTKLVYDYYGSGDRSMDLTYGLLMTPSAYNDYYPKLVTDATNRVVLNSAYAQAARIAGIPNEGLLGTPSSDVRNRFVEAMMGENIISPTTAMEIESVTYNNVMGLGNQYEATQPMKEITYDELLSLLTISPTTSFSSDNFYGGLQSVFGTQIGAGRKAILQKDNTALGGIYNYEDQKFLGITIHESKWAHQGNVKAEDQLNALSNLSLKDLLYNPDDSNNPNYLIGVMSEDGENLPFSEILAFQDLLTGAGGYLDWLYDAFASVLGTTTESNLALQNAYNTVFDIVCPNGGIAQSQYSSLNLPSDPNDWLEFYDEDENYIAAYGYLRMIAKETKCTSENREYNCSEANECKDYLGFTFTRDTNVIFGFGGSDTDGDGDHGNAWRSIWHDDDIDRSQCSISLSNLARAFLTSYVNYMQDETENLHYGDLNGSNTLYDGTGDFKFTIPDDSEIEDYSNNLNAGFYDAMFNIICTQGWVENERIDDKDYLAQMFKNGMMFISSIASDGYYHQGGYSTDHAVVEVTDDDAIARAQAKYNTEKARIESKEDTIDMKMKNLDTEISTLTTEYDSVKQLISKSVERAIKRYDA